MLCPLCNSINTGKIGSNIYYCSDCLMEFLVSGGKLKLHYIDAEGNTIVLKDKQMAQKIMAYMQEYNQSPPAEELQELIGTAEP